MPCLTPGRSSIGCIPPSQPDASGRVLIRVFDNFPQLIIDSDLLRCLPGMVVGDCIEGFGKVNEDDAEWFPVPLTSLNYYVKPFSPLAGG